MKTKIIPQSFDSPATPLGMAPVTTRLAGFGRFLLTSLCVALVSLVSLPDAEAGAADGKYKFVSASGSLTAGGDTIVLPQDFIQDIGSIQDGKITVKDNTIKLNVANASKIIEEIGTQLGLDFEITVTGPKTIKLKKSGKNYVGVSKKPLVIAFKTIFEGDEVVGELRIMFNAKVKGKKLTLKADIEGEALATEFTGALKIDCKR